MRVEHRRTLWWTEGIWEAAQAPNGERVGQRVGNGDWGGQEAR